MSSKKKSGTMRVKRNQRYNKMAMIGISFVVCMLLAVLFIQGQSVKERITVNTQKQEELAQQIEEENQRTEDIEELQRYMQSDEYVEKIAKEKIGLVKENEIIFKEAD